jgi:hypothetical protein
MEISLPNAHLRRQESEPQKQNNTRPEDRNITRERKTHSVTKDVNHPPERTLQQTLPKRTSKTDNRTKRRNTNAEQESSAHSNPKKNKHNEPPTLSPHHVSNYVLSLKEFLD